MQIVVYVSLTNILYHLFDIITQGCHYLTLIEKKLIQEMSLCF